MSRCVLYGFVLQASGCFLGLVSRSVSQVGIQERGNGGAEGSHGEDRVDAMGGQSSPCSARPLGGGDRGSIRCCYCSLLTDRAIRFLSCCP